MCGRFLERDSEPTHSTDRGGFVFIGELSDWLDGLAVGFEVIDGALELGGGSSVRDGALVCWWRVCAGWDFHGAIERREFITSACGRH
jgi:hypothetical protein